MIRTTAIVILLVGLVVTQYCPDFLECSLCEPGWGKPDITETDQYVGPDSCNVTLSWIYPFTENDNRTNPRMVLHCSYANNRSCVQATEDVCASCQELVIEGVHPSGNPHVTYSDSCGGIDTIPIARNCEPPTTPLPIPTTVLTTKGDTLTTTADPDVVMTITPQVITTSGEVYSTTASTPIVCRGSYQLIGNKCMFVNASLQANWNDARSYCNQMRGDLVSIDDDETFVALFHYIYDNNLDSNDFWIGASDSLSEGNFFWLNGSPLEKGTPYWAIYAVASDEYFQEPVNNQIIDYDCVQMDRSRYLYYDDDDCNFQKAGICEENS